MPNFTKRAIMESFLKLLEEKPVNKITVKDIVEDCGVNRNTFYYHFEDLPSLIETLLKMIADELLKDKSSIDSLEECMLTVLKFAMNNKKAMLHLCNSASRDIYVQYLNIVCRSVIEDYMQRASADYNVKQSDLELIIDVFTFEVVGFVLDWIGKGMKSDAVDMVKRTCCLFEGMIEMAFRRSSEN